jgi:hypothetical protein
MRILRSGIVLRILIFVVESQEAGQKIVIELQQGGGGRKKI